MIQQCEDQERFLISFLLDQLVEFYQGKFDYQSLTLFHESMKEFLDHSFITLFNSLITKIEGIANRTSAAKFVLERLVNDFKQFIDIPKQMFQFPPSLMKEVFQKLTEDIDQRISNKILASATRFTFSNAILWNSFHTIIEQSTSISLPLFKQVFTVIMVGHAISKDPSLKTELCPDLTDENVLFILSHFSPDDNMPFPVDSKSFSDFYQIEVPRQATPLSLSSSVDLKSLKPDIDFKYWNRVSLKTNEFSYFSKYANKSEF